MFSARVGVVDELVERVDDQDRALGVAVSRRQAVREGWLHRVAGALTHRNYRIVWLTNDGRRIDFVVDAESGAILSGG